MKSVLVCEGSSAARVFDRGSFARTMIYEVEDSLQQPYGRTITAAKERRSDREPICNHLPMALGTVCKSFYGVCNKTGSLPAERREALGLLDVRGPLEQCCGFFRGNLVEHLLVDSLTKCMPTDSLTSYLKDMICVFSYDHQLKDTHMGVRKDTHACGIAQERTCGSTTRTPTSRITL